MRKQILLLTLCLSFFTAFSQTKEKYSRATVWLINKTQTDLARLGIDLTEGNLRKGVSFTSEFSATEITRMRNADFTVEIVAGDINDNLKPGAQGFVCPSDAPAYNVPASFTQGSMGGYYTYNEMLQILDDMAALYPSLISVKQPIDTTTSIEGRPIYFVKISDNVNVQESEPDVLYTALHHAREPIGMSQLIFYMWYLLENYPADAEVASIIDHTELYFVPCINPDGYIYNETTNPQGGGFWRKNRRDNGDGSFGVDLNRNYGHNWGFDDTGSSPDGFMETYRGAAPFSEPETQAMRNFTDSFEFKLALNYHAFSNLLIYPWGYLPDFYTPDSSLFAHYGNLLTQYNNYLAGTSNQTVEYQVNGGSDDWMYGEQLLKPKVMAMTPEVGDQFQGFWPPDVEIIPLSLENIFANLSLAHLAGPYANIEDISEYEVSNLNDFVYFNFHSIGLDSVASFTVSVTPLSPTIDSAGASVVFTNPQLTELLSDSIPLYLSSSVLPGDEVSYILSVDNGLFAINDTIHRIFGMPTVVYSDNATSMAAFTGSWGIDNNSYLSAPSSISDSPFGNYQAQTSSNITLTNAVDLSNAVSARLSFYAKWHIEPDFDFAQVLASSDNGLTWNPLCGKYTVEGSASQDLFNPVYEGRQLQWVKEDIDLSGYAGMNIKIRFRLLSDAFSEYDGFYFDDLSIRKVLVTGTEEITQAGIRIYPNPAVDYIYTGTGKGHSVEVYDIAGRCILTAPYQDPVDITSLPEGVYNLKIHTSEEIRHGRFVKLNSH